MSQPPQATEQQTVRHQCSLCNRSYVRKEGLSKHQVKHAKASEKPTKDSDVPAPAGRLFKKPGDGRYYCTVATCPRKSGVGYTYERDVKAHFKRIHDPTFVPPTCETCNKSFYTKSNLKRHVAKSCGGRYKH